MPYDRQPLGDRPQVMEIPGIRWTGERAERLIVVSNRGPIEHSFDEEGVPVAQRGAGGVVSGLLCALRERPVTWIALAMTEADHLVARARGKATIPGPVDLSNIALRLVDVPAATYKRHYDGISNSILWFAQHYLLQPNGSTQFSDRTRKNWDSGYLAVNAAIAEAVAVELRRSGSQTPVLFQDYHLYTAPALVRERFPEARLAHFVHIPWPESRYWELLPEDMVRAIFAGLASNDVIGFQTRRDARNFLEGASRFLDGATIRREADAAGGSLVWNDRRIRVQAYPIAVTPEEVHAGADAPEANEEMRALGEELRLSDAMKLIVRVDRVEPTKNIVRGFEAYERMLRAHPELHGKVTFLALLVPSRQGVAAYRAYERRIRALVDRINARYGTDGWQPVVAIFGNHRARALACMRRYDVLLVNPVIDGMNLVVKEGALVNDRAGVIVLSRTAGAYEQLGEHVVGVPPLDVRATADALYQALAMSVAEREAHAAALDALLSADSAAIWLETQISDLREHVRAVRAARRAAELGATGVQRVPSERPVRPVAPAPVGIAAESAITISY